MHEKDKQQHQDIKSLFLFTNISGLYAFQVLIHGRSVLSHAF